MLRAFRGYGTERRAVDRDVQRDAVPAGILRPDDARHGWHRGNAADTEDIGVLRKRGEAHRAYRQCAC